MIRDIWVVLLLLSLWVARLTRPCYSQTDCKKSVLHTFRSPFSDGRKIQAKDTNINGSEALRIDSLNFAPHFRNCKCFWLRVQYAWYSESHDDILHLTGLGMLKETNFHQCKQNHVRVTQLICMQGMQSAYCAYVALMQAYCPVTIFSSGLYEK